LFVNGEGVSYLQHQVNPTDEVIIVAVLSGG
jgi:sulfur carrier protein ThiS